MSLVKLRILGVVSVDVVPDITKGLVRKTNGNYIDFFCSYSDFEIPLGTKFCKVIHKNSEVKILIKLIDVTQQWGIPFDIIPVGHKTICRFEALESVDVFDKLCDKIKSWDEADDFLEILSC